MTVQPRLTTHIHINIEPVEGCSTVTTIYTNLRIYHEQFNQNNKHYDSIISITTQKTSNYSTRNNWMSYTSWHYQYLTTESSVFVCKFSCLQEDTYQVLIFHDNESSKCPNILKSMKECINHYPPMNAPLSQVNQKHSILLDAWLYESQKFVLQLFTLIQKHQEEFLKYSTFFQTVGSPYVNKGMHICNYHYVLGAEDQCLKLGLVTSKMLVVFMAFATWVTGFG